MPISKKLKTIYIHIPKTAGTSISKSIGIHQNPDALYGRRVINNKLYILQHLSMTQLLELGFVSDNMLEKYFSFSFVRNPWDRMVSEYEWQFRTQPNDRPSFEQYLKWIYPLVMKKKFEMSMKEYTYWLDKYRIDTSHLPPESDFLYHQNNLAVKFVGRFESLVDDMNVVFKTLNLKKKLGKKTKETDRKPYQYYYNSATKGLISEMYQEDIISFNYEYD